MMFDPHVGWPQQNKMGDYFDMVSDADGAHLAWANTLNGEQDVYYSYIIPETVGMKDHDANTRAMITANPNPFSGEVNIVFELNDAARVKLTIYDMLGNEIALLENRFMDAGVQRTAYNGYDLPNGIYIIALEADGVMSRTKVIKTR